MNSVAERSEDVKFWRDEKTDSAIYSVFLKKVRYRSSCELDIDEPDAQKVAHLLWQTQKQRVIRAGTVERIVDSLLLDNGEIDSAHVNIFLATYRTFSTLAEVVGILIDKYKMYEKTDSPEDGVNESHSRTIRTIFTMWMDSYPDDFHRDCVDSIQSIVDCLSSSKSDNDVVQKLKQRLTLFQQSNGSMDDSDGDSIDLDISIESQGILDIPSTTFAEQLTYIDAKLFSSVIPHQCLGSVWSHRDDQGQRSDAPTVAATIQQFNAVSYRVVSTILHNTDLKPAQRAKIIMKWIEISQELRVIKNFSSLKAIISGLQSNPIYRLRKTWALVSKSSAALFDELSDIFSEENNQIVCRELLQKEGTAKFASMERSGSKIVRKKSMQKQRTWMENGVIQGTVPYLGTFLTDLTMIDTAMPDTVEDGLINFDKKRKEFEVIVQICLLQKSARNYVIKRDPEFLHWFNSLPVYSENKSHDVSCEVEPNPSPKNVSLKKKSASFGGRKHFSSDSLNSTIDELTPGCSPSPSPLMTSKNQHSDSPLLPDDVSVAFRSSESCVIKVSLQTEQTPNVNVYKSIMLTNRDHTKTVIQNSLLKYGVDDDPDLYCVSQVFQDGSELQIPDKANVFYGMNNTGILTFVVRTKDFQHILDSLPKTGRKKTSKHSKNDTL